jgi:ferrous iron transport protein B
MSLQKKRLRIAVAGNPNCGKTTLFNELTGSRQMVGNWPGVTVDRKTGFYAFEGHDFELVDIPGIYALSAHSSDEKVARDYLLSEDYDLIVNIVDAANIERNLYLTTQLLEMRVPMIVVLNKMDVAKSRQILINTEELSDRLGIPVVPIAASKRSGLTQLKKAVHQCAEHNPISEADIIYPVEIQEAATTLTAQLSKIAAENNLKADWLAMKLLEDDLEYVALLDTKATEDLTKRQQKLVSQLDEDADIAIADARYGFINWLTANAVTHASKLGKTVTDTIEVVLNRVLGLPIFLLMMYLTFMFTINVGGAFIDFFDIAAGAVFVDGMTTLLNGLNAPAWLIGVLATGVGGGIQTVATFIPPIGFMFLALAVLEGSGYMARAAFVMDRFMRMIGLPGKSFVPLLVGLAVTFRRSWRPELWRTNVTAP